MKCSIEAVQTFQITLDMQSLSVIERALSFFTERAILPDGDPARDLSRQFTSMLLRLSSSQRASERPSLPAPASEVPDVEDEPESAPAPESDAQEAPGEVNPLEEELETMMGDRPLPPADAESKWVGGDARTTYPRFGGTDSGGRCA